MAEEKIKKTENGNQESSDERGHWKHPIEFLLSMFGYAIGMANVWRFPYLTMRNGGGAFLIPYIIFIVVIGIPLVTLECVLGQYFQLGPLLVFNICPLFKGVGASVVLLSFFSQVYYNTILAWSLYYLTASFSSTLPWSTCDNSWNTNSCIPIDGSYINVTNGSLFSKTSNSSRYMATEEYWRYNVLQTTAGIEDLGGIRWQILVALVVANLLIFVCIFKGIQSSRIAVYITATLPFLLLIILFVWLLTRTGSSIGLLYYVTPRWEKMSNYQTWLEAFLHVFFSNGCGWGGLITTASFNPFRHNCMRDAILLSIADMLTAILCGAVVFAGLGCIAYQTNSQVEDVITAGPGLSFITYPQVVSSMPVPQLWAICFFLLIISLGLDTMFVSLKTITTGITDLYPKQLTKYHPVIVLVVIIISLILGIPFVTQGGVYVFQIIDWYIAVFTIVFVAICECIIVMWIYGGDKFVSNIREMSSFGSSWYLQCLKFAWKFLIPVFLSLTLILTMVKFRSPTYGDYVYPEWTNAFGWFFALSSSFPILILMIHTLATTPGTISERIRKSIRPTIGRKGVNITSTHLEEMTNLNIQDKDTDKQFI